MNLLLHSAQKFLEEFVAALDGPKKKMTEADANFQYRKTCISGFMALDCALSVYWKEIVVPEWAEMMAHCGELLEDDDSLEQLLKNLNGSLTRGQLVASLKFLENTGEPERFSPSLVDCGIVFALTQDHLRKLPFLETAEKICRLQKDRNNVFHSGKNFSEIEAATAIKGLKEVVALMPRLNPIFRDCFTQTPQKILKAA